MLNGRFAVYASDLDSPEPVDFLECRVLPDPSVRGIITNPPYDDAEQFCRHALELTRPFMGWVAMLLRVNFDSAKTRADLFARCPAWAKKIVLTERIVWFEGPVPCKRCGATGIIAGSKCKSCRGKGEAEHQPSENHAWYVWDWRHQLGHANGAPAIIAYAP